MGKIHKDAEFGVKIGAFSMEDKKGIFTGLRQMNLKDD